MAVLMLFPEVRNQLAHDVKQIMLEIFQIKRVDIVRAFLHHDRAGGVMRCNADRAVLYAGGFDNLHHFLRHIVKSGNPPARLQLQFLLINLEFHFRFSVFCFIFDSAVFRPHRAGE